MNIIIEIRSKSYAPLSKALRVAKEVYDIRAFEVYYGNIVTGTATVLDLDVSFGGKGIDTVFDEFVEKLRIRHGQCMVICDMSASNGGSQYRIAYGTRQGPGA